jgi:hypothetical protein
VEELQDSIGDWAHVAEGLAVSPVAIAFISHVPKLDKYQLLILDDIAYVTKDQAETSVLFDCHDPGDERRELSPESCAQAQAWLR